MGDKRVELSYTSATSETPLLGDTIGANFDRTAAAFPDRPALVDVPAGLRYTYGELKDEVDALAYGLHQAGIRQRSSWASRRNVSRSSNGSHLGIGTRIPAPESPPANMREFDGVLGLPK